jgi:hypothetical protein
MLEASQNLEQVAIFFAPRILIIPGILSILIGLCIWLGGLRFNRLIATVGGALAGLILTFQVTEHRAATITLAVLVGAGLALFFKRIAVILIAVLITALAVLIISAGPDYQAATPVPLSEFQFSGNSGTEEKLDVEESLEIVKLFLNYYYTEISNTVREGAKNPEGLAFALIGALIIAAFGAFMSRLTVSVTLSVLGVGIICLGMILLLLYKGAHPISHIYERMAIYNSVFLIMIVFGAAVELLLCPNKKKKLLEAKANNGEK